MSAAPEPGRRLAAVWFADIVGYTALSSRDEDAALHVVAAFQRVAEEVVSQHAGRVVKYIGDAALAEFASTDGAIRSALTLMERFVESEEARRYGTTLRIGVNVGEVISAPDGDIYGDGVNLASRLQNQAAPGQVIASEAVHAQIRQRPVFRTEPLGQRAVKGISAPVTLYAVTLQDAAGGPAVAAAGQAPPAAPPSARRFPRWIVPVALVGAAAAALVVFDPGGMLGRLRSGGGGAEVRASYPVVEGGMEVGATITLELPAAVDPATATSANVRLLDAQGAAVPSQVSVGGDPRTLAVRPLAALAYDAAYSLVLGDALRDAGGNPFSAPPTELRTQPVPAGGRPAADEDAPGGAPSRPVRAGTPPPRAEAEPPAARPDRAEPAAAAAAPGTGPATLNLTATPEAALPFLKVVVDGDTLGPPPVRGVRLAEGRTHNVAVVGVPELSSYSLVVFRREVAAQAGQVVDISAQITAFGSIDVVSQPAGTVFVDGRQVGRTPLAGYPVTAGVVHRLEIRPTPADAAGFSAWTGEFRVGPLEWKSLGRVTLPPKGGTP